MSEERVRTSAIRFSTEDFPEKHRLEAWRELIGRVAMGADLLPLKEKSPIVIMERRMIGDIGLVKAEQPAYRSIRSKSSLANSPDNLLLFCAEGLVRVEQSGREVTLEAGSATLIDTTVEGKVIIPETHRGGGLVLKRSALEPMLRSNHLDNPNLIPKHDEILNYIKKYITFLWELQPESAAFQASITSHIHELVALMLGAHNDVAEYSAATGGLAAMRLTQIADYVKANLHRRELSLSEIAAQQRVSARYLRSLLESKEMTFSKLVRDMRLEKARHMLTQPQYLFVKISTIAYDCGFGELSNFNHAFRARFGQTPREIREMAKKSARDT
ncbi:AraC family transcriptional regulator [Rhizobium freirei]|nr:AraC family transcriptional regulator [Rhizobium freirei]